MPQIHPTAIVHASAKIHPEAIIGPWCLVDAEVQISAGVTLESRVHVYPYVSIGAHTHVYDGAILGAVPQDLKFQGEVSHLIIGENCQIREYCTLNRGTQATQETRIGDFCLLMAYVHVAHDCKLGQGVVLANQVQLGGHVEIGDFATLGGNVAVQQFTRIGAFAFVAGTLKIERDLPPASRAMGNPVRWAGLNLHALRKHNFTKERIARLEEQYYTLFNVESTLAQGVEQLMQNPQVDPLLSEYFCHWKGGLVVPNGKFA